MSVPVLNPNSGSPKPNSVIAAARSDPLGAGIIVCGVLLAALMVAWQVTPEGMIPRAIRSVRALKPGPAKWRAAARPGDVLAVPGYTVAYYGNPKAPYGVAATRVKQRPIALVIHHTADAPILKLVQYGHNADHERGGGSYGYHFYIDRDGRIAQGAPLSRRTNHIKPPDSPKRTRVAAKAANWNAIGVALVGACKVKPKSGITERCEREVVTPAQNEAAAAVVAALLAAYRIPGTSVWGHGELQSDREPFEGKSLAMATREAGPVLSQYASR